MRTETERVKQVTDPEAMETITDDTVIEKLRELLQNADMETTTGN